MNDVTFTVAAAAFDKPKDFQIGKALLPSKEVLEAIGRAAVRFGQLEHLLKLVYKRSGNDISLKASLEKLDGGSLGALLNGIRYGEIEKFEGLKNLAKSNPQLACIQDHLDQADGLSKIRKRYVHNGIGVIPDGRFVFMDTGVTIEESQMVDELDTASTLAESLFSEINKKVPPKSKELYCPG
jgi:hypothetical protein